MTSIAALTEADRDEWLDLWHGYLTFYESTVPDDVTMVTFRRLVTGDGMHGALARDDEGRATGIVHWLFHPATWSRGPYCYLEDLFVDPGVRGGGIGRALITHVAAQATAAGAEKVYWLTQDDNSTARALYDKVATHTGFTHYAISL